MTVSVVSFSVVNNVITIKFSKPVKTSVSEFQYTMFPNPGGWLLNWSENDTKVIMQFNNYVTGGLYTFRIQICEAQDGTAFTGTNYWTWTVDGGLPDYPDFPDDPVEIPYILLIGIVIVVIVLFLFWRSKK